MRHKGLAQDLSRKFGKHLLLGALIYLFICHLLMRADISDRSELHLLCVGRIDSTSPSAVGSTRVVRQGKTGNGFEFVKAFK